MARCGTKTSSTRNVPPMVLFKTHGRSGTKKIIPLNIGLSFTKESYVTDRVRIILRQRNVLFSLCFSLLFQISRYLYLSFYLSLPPYLSLSLSVCSFVCLSASFALHLYLTFSVFLSVCLTHTYTHTHTHTRTDTHTYTHTHTQLHTYTNRFKQNFILRLGSLTFPLLCSLVIHSEGNAENMVIFHLTFFGQWRRNFVTDGLPQTKPPRLATRNSCVVLLGNT